MRVRWSASACILESGDGVAKDIAAANALYEKAAARGSADGAINLAVALMNGKGVEKNVSRAAALLRTASQGGSADRDLRSWRSGAAGRRPANPPRRSSFFRRSTSLGDPRGYLAAAILLDEGRGVPKNAAAAADQLLRGVAGDDGSAFDQLTAKASLMVA